ncbi:MAG: helicase C-terminal domain-containing protein [Opitutaceae bacterium]|nr:helicase C-terminal domain-containing protein [Opitutaceae bacterium]
MQFSLEQRTASLSVGEFADFTMGLRESGDGPRGLWRAQLGQQWHGELRNRTRASSPTAQFEVPIEGRLRHREWTFHLAGRIDQLLPLDPAASTSAGPAGGRVLLREIKTVTCPLPALEPDLRADYPAYFLQLAAYLVLWRAAPPPLASGLASPASPNGELVFVETCTGLSQSVGLTPFDEALVFHQLDAIADFLELRLRATARRRSLLFRPAFATLRPGQETIQSDLAFHLSPPASCLLFEAPTGYGKTGCVLEFALSQLRAGRFARLIWLTSKATGQLHVMYTLATMAIPRPSLPSNCPSPSPPSTICHPIGDKFKRSAPAICNPIGDNIPATRPSGAIEADGAAPTPVAAWQVRPKSEHCINSTFHCVRAACSFLDGAAARWPQSGLTKFQIDESSPHDLDTLRSAGRDAHICPYEITRLSLPFSDVWIGDYNYVFSPDNRGLFYEQPGFDPVETLLVIDEAHNLPSRVADAFSHVVRAADARFVLEQLYRQRPLSSLLLAWENWARFLSRLPHTEHLDEDDEADLRDTLEHLAGQVAISPLDYAALGPEVSDQLWQPQALLDFLDNSTLEKLLSCPRAGELRFTCLDAAPVIGEGLRAYGGVILMSGTLNPPEAFLSSCGLGAGSVEPVPLPRVEPSPALGKLSRRSRRILRGLTSGAELLRVEESREAARPHLLHARAPWREQAYDVAIDLRVDTTLRHRASHYSTTAATVAALQAAAARRSLAGDRADRAGDGGPPSPAEKLSHSPPFDPCPSLPTVAVFFPSYAYADNIVEALESAGSTLRVALQPRLPDLAAQTAWVEESLTHCDALFLVLGSSFAEGIDLLGGRVTHAMVVGPALPEVNAVQRARMSILSQTGLSRDAAFRRVYQIPGMTKVNQALGRLVRSPGQHARVLLHCRRFADPTYAALLAPEYQSARGVTSDTDLASWLGRGDDTVSPD